MSAKHTPGPWSYWPDVAYPEGVITSDKTAGHIAIPSRYVSDMKANAMLIAAAPEMLAALEFAKTFMERRFSEIALSRGEPAAICYREICAAIAKAKGAK